MDDIKLPGVIEFYQKKDLGKGRHQTTANLFMMDAEVFETICMGYIRGEISTVESRVGTTIKHPKDKYDKKLAKQAAFKNLKKQRINILDLTVKNSECSLMLESGLVIVKRGNRILVYDYSKRYGNFMGAV